MSKVQYQWFGPGKKSRDKNHKRISRGRRLRSEKLENRQLLAANLFHNEMMPEDVNEDGEITALDALAIINEMGRQSRGELQTGAERGPGRMTDVNNDGRESALDALMVINRLSRDANRGPRANGGLESPGGPPPQEQSADNNQDNQGNRDPGETQEQSDVVLEWNNLFNELLVADESNQNPGYASRAMAMLNLAIYDAVTLASGDSSDSFYEYEVAISDDTRVKSEIAASQAAYTVLSSLYPDQQDMIDGFRDEVFGQFRRSETSADSVELGTEIGEQIIAERADDGSADVYEHTYTDEIGYFQADPLNPDVPVWGPGWGEVDTFAISSAEDFAPETTPPITSAEYAESYNEVKELGSVDSTIRTADQTEAGIFWAYDRVGLGTPMSLFNDVLETIAVQEGNTLEENAALFAQASVAMADAGVVAWHTKFGEDFWRPVTAIREGDNDDNPLTEGDEEWTALGAPDGGDDIIGFTPQFPTYISGHATFGGALFGAIQQFYGTDDIAFDLTSNELEVLLENPELQEAYGLDLDDAQRSFDSLSEAMAENGRSRVYLGIHFDFDDLVGQEVGQAVAEAVSAEFAVAPNEDGANAIDQPDRQRQRRNRRASPESGQQNRAPNRNVGSNDAAINGGDLLSETTLPLDTISEDDLELLAQDQVERRQRGRHEQDHDRDEDDQLGESIDMDLLEVGNQA